jgi:hypothetical protein
MALAHHETDLGPPDVKLAGFQLWVHGRQFPEAQDYWDGNWLRVTAHCGAKGASVWAGGAILMVTDLARWVDQCQELWERKVSEAALYPLELELRVILRSKDLQGHILLRVEITPEPGQQQHTFEFEIDQSFLPSLISQCRTVIREYPIRDPQSGGG